jgi:hypothetical protein
LRCVFAMVSALSRQLTVTIISRSRTVGKAQSAPATAIINLPRCGIPPAVFVAHNVRQLSSSSPGARIFHWMKPPAAWPSPPHQLAGSHVLAGQGREGTKHPEPNPAAPSSNPWQLSVHCHTPLRLACIALGVAKGSGSGSSWMLYYPPRRPMIDPQGGARCSFLFQPCSS